MRGSLSIAIAALIVALTACGDSEDGSTGGDGLTTVNASYVPYVGAAPFELGVTKGIFEKHGLDVKISQGAAPAPIMAQVTSGQLDIGFTTIPALISAASNGAPLQAIAPFDGVVDPKAPATAIMVRKDSPIRSPRDLAGKKVGVVALKSELDLLMHVLVDRDGGDGSKAQSVQVPFPEMTTALISNRVDAVVNTEPFVTLAKEEGVRAIAYPEVEVVPRGTVTAWVASKRYIDANGDTIRRFAEAMREALAYTRDHPAEARRTMVKVADIKPSLLSRINLGTIFDPKLNLGSIQRFLDQMKQYRFIDEPVALDDIVHRGAR